MLADVALQVEDADEERSHRLRSPGFSGDPLPPPVGQMFAELRGVETTHGLAEAPRDLGHVVGVPEVRGRLHDGGRHPGRIRRLEDPRTHEHGFGAQLHHERSIRRGGDPPGTEQRNGQASDIVDLLHQPDGRRSSLAQP